MKKLGTVGVTLMGLYSLSMAAPLASLPVATIGFGIDGVSGGFAVAALNTMPAALSIMFGLYLIYNRQYLAARWFGDEELNTGMETSQVLRLGLVLIGVSLVVGAATTIAGIVVFAIGGGIAGTQDMVSGRILGDLFGLARPMTQALLGALLIRYAHRLAAWFLRDGDASKPVEVVRDLPVCPECGAAYDPDDYAWGAEHRCRECGAILQG